MARRWRPSHLVFLAGAAYLILISLKFRRVLDLAAADLAAVDRAFSSPSSSDHLPPLLPGSSSNATLFQVQPFWHRYDRVSLPDIAARNRSALDRMADDAWSLGLTAWEDAAAFSGDPWVLAAVDAASTDKCPAAVSMRARGRVVFLPCGLAAGSSVTVVGTPRAAHKEYVPQLATMRQGDGPCTCRSSWSSCRACPPSTARTRPGYCTSTPGCGGTGASAPSSSTIPATGCSGAPRSAVTACCPRTTRIRATRGWSEQWGIVATQQAGMLHAGASW